MTHTYPSHFVALSAVMIVSSLADAQPAQTSTQPAAQLPAQPVAQPAAQLPAQPPTQPAAQPPARPPARPPAQPPAQPPTQEHFPVTQRATRDWALTISPIHFVLPVLEATAEKRISSKWGLAGLLGLGQVSVDSLGQEYTFNVLELGLSARYYVWGDFEKGMQIGAAIEFISLSGGDLDTVSDPDAANGLQIAPFIGYKYTLNSGLTFDAQLGPAYTDSESEDATDTYLNLNVGWTL